MIEEMQMMQFMNLMERNYLVEDFKLNMQNLQGDLMIVAVVEDDTVEAVVTGQTEIEEEGEEVVEVDLAANMADPTILNIELLWRTFQQEPAGRTLKITSDKLARWLLLSVTGKKWVKAL